MNETFGKSRTIHTVRWLEVDNLLRALEPQEYYASLHERKIIKWRIDSVADEIRKWLLPVIDLTEFVFAYHTNGTHSAIEQWLASESRPICCLSGEYPYPRHFRRDILVVNTVSEIPPNHIVFISNPFSSSGKYDSRYQMITNPVILDCAYVGTTATARINLTPNTEQVFWSGSKPFGIGHFRTGFRFCRKPDLLQEQLKDTGYFNWFGIELLDRCVKLWSVDTAYNNLAEAYIKLCETYELMPSDTYLIASSLNDEYNHLAREDGIIRIPTGLMLDAAWR